MKSVLLSAACAVALLGLSNAASAADIDPAKIADHVKIRASDAFEGRGPATAGETKTVEYITQQYKAAGLQPGGDLKDGQRAWTQDVPLARFDMDGPVAASFTVNGKAVPLAQGDDIAIRASIVMAAPSVAAIELIRMSRCSTCPSSCAITPSSSRSSITCNSPSVTATAACDGLRPVANALGEGSGVM